jgi:hypothetical protein
MKNIHILPTDKPSRLYLTTHEYIFESGYSYSTDECQNKHIYITNNEEIKEGDYYYLPRTNSVYKCNEDPTELNLEGRLGVAKIILTTDQDLIKDGVQAIDDEFLQWFVKNPSCEKVEIEYLVPKVDNPFQQGILNGLAKSHPDIVKKPYIIIPKEEPLYDYGWCKGNVILPKEEPKLSNICIKCGVDSYYAPNFICQEHPKNCKGIHLSEETLQEWASKKEEPKQDKIMERFIANAKQKETLEEAAEKHFLNSPDAYGINEECRNSFIEGAKWQQERMYSEEEVLKMLNYLIMMPSSKLDEFTNDEEMVTMKWFEQFKKK